MYNPLIKIQHGSGTESFVRVLDIKEIHDWKDEQSVKIEGNKFINVKNIKEIVEKVNQVEERNESTMIYQSNV